ncbi:MAG: ABC transporter substrate-binding protein, partial [Pseudomonadota bacterium]
FSFKCPNDRYLNDEAVCQAVTAMLAKAGITAKLETMPVRNYFTEMRENVSDLYLLGWSPGTFDHEHPIRFLLATPNSEKKLGSWNFGGYSNARVDELLPLIQSELDEGKRQAMIDEVVEITKGETAYVPLYVQPLIWGAKDNVTLVQRPDNFFILRWVNVE